MLSRVRSSNVELQTIITEAGVRSLRILTTLPTLSSLPPSELCLFTFYILWNGYAYGGLQEVGNIEDFHRPPT